MSTAPETPPVQRPSFFTTAVLGAVVALMVGKLFFEVFAAGLAGLYQVVPVYGLAIILLTIAVRLLLLPLSIKQTRSMREMQRIQPEIKKLQAKHKGNRQKLNEEMMALYKEHGVNPFGGCLPLLMQMPVFIALYRVISAPLAYMGYKAVKGAAPGEWPLDPASNAFTWVTESSLAEGLRHSFERVNEFLWVFRLDCSPANVFNRAPASQGELAVSCYGGVAEFLPYAVLILLMGYTTYYQQKQMQSRTPASNDPQAKQMQTFARIMPLMLMFFSFTFPAGLTLYWVTTNVWSIGQQAVMLRSSGDDAGGTTPGRSGKGKGTGAPGPSKPPKGSPTQSSEPVTKKKTSADRNRRKKK